MLSSNEAHKPRKITEDINNAIDIQLLWETLDKHRADLPALNLTAVPIESMVLLATILYQIKDIKTIGKLIDLSYGNIFPPRLVFNKMSKEMIIQWYARPREASSSHYLTEASEVKGLLAGKDPKIVFGQFPFGMQIFPSGINAGASVSIDVDRGPTISIEAKVDRGDRKEYIRRIDSSNNLILFCVEAIKQNSIGVFLTLPYFKTFEKDNLRARLQDQGIFVNGLINLPKGFMGKITNLQPMIIIVSREKTDKEFILDISSLKNYDFNLGNLFNNVDSDDISIGNWISPDSFRGFEALKLSKELDAIRGDYSEFPSYPLKEICKEINMGKYNEEFKERSDTVYVPLIGRQQAVNSVDHLKIKHQNYAQLIVDRDVIIPEYMKAFLNSKIGIVSLETGKVGFIPRLRKIDLAAFEIPTPDLAIQEKVASTINKYNYIKDKLEEIGETLSVRPFSDETTTETIDSIMENVGTLSELDQIYRLIRNGEDKNTEFKQTYCLDIRSQTKEQYITDAITKTIAAFLNSDGGTLLVGVSDNQEITGLKDEMNKFFSKGRQSTEDTFKLTLKNLIKDNIGEGFYPLIDYKLIPVDSDWLLRITCHPSDKEVYINKGRDFYVRTNPATDKLEGQNLTNYVKHRFWNQPQT